MTEEEFREQLNLLLSAMGEHCDNGYGARHAAAAASDDGPIRDRQLVVGALMLRLFLSEYDTPWSRVAREWDDLADLYSCNKWGKYQPKKMCTATWTALVDAAPSLDTTRWARHAPKEGRKGQ